MEFRKIIDKRKTNSGNRTPRNENQKRAATLRMILHNPMFNEAVRRKSAEARKGRRPPKPFQLNNQNWKLRKDLKTRKVFDIEMPETSSEDTSNSIIEYPLLHPENTTNIKRKTVTCRPVRSYLIGDL